jgi:hypothetical protein
VSGPYVLTVIVDGKEWEGDAKHLVEGKMKSAGLARYCNDPRLSPSGVGGGKSRYNVTFARKEGRTNTWGIKVRPGTTITKGEEIFVEYGRQYVAISPPSDSS